VCHAIFDTVDVNTFPLGNNVLLMSSDKYFKQFLSGEVLHRIPLYLIRERGDF